MTYTRFGQVFLGLEGGIVVPGATGAARAGWILDTTPPSEDAIHNFVDGGFVAGEAYIPFGPVPFGLSLAGVWGGVPHWGFRIGPLKWDYSPVAESS